MTNATPVTQPPTEQPFASWNPTRGIWETTQLDLYGLSAPFSGIWSTCGWMRDGSAYPLPLSALLTNASASSPSPGALFRTPTGERLITRRGDTRPGAGQARDDRALAPDHRLRPPRTGWLAEQESRIGDAVWSLIDGLFSAGDATPTPSPGGTHHRTPRASASTPERRRRPTPSTSIR